MKYRQKRAELAALYSQGFFTPEQYDQEMRAVEYAYGETKTAEDEA